MNKAALKFRVIDRQRNLVRIVAAPTKLHAVEFVAAEQFGQPDASTILDLEAVELKTYGFSLDGVHGVATVEAADENEAARIYAHCRVAGITTMSELKARYGSRLSISRG